MPNKTIGYIRTSKNNQNLGVKVQKEALIRYNIDSYFIEQISGRKENRKELNKALESLEKGDTLVVYKIDRLGRSTKQLVNIMSELQEKGINLISIKENIDTSTPMGKVIFTILSAIAELEADYISERTKEALAVLKENGVKLGNKGLDVKTVNKIKKLYTETTLTQREIAEKCDVCIKTVYNVKRKYRLSR
ncbi:MULTISPECIES: recombinase family protein [Enterococcus]|uniref:recombinase family protein n=1 Tax=Enterococcus TaxID=1350 RepID=UPI001927459C|nr:recombinase family protein [Enterococcus faecalis]MCD4978776.1 recombinase family protein [Enterococcus faecalis]MCU2263451.1 recombinase family protein [Enterococcus faecalis]MDG4629379.1 recombinase family protein [Enterococcus faecalis]MDG4632075.1 recombinase family protein [Enterococcus faecalis]GMC13244.1 recombinase family protein [Enterococcus faecalis]